MEELVNNIIDAFTWQEALAVFFSILYIILAAKESLWCWAAAIISIFLYIYILLDAGLLAETGLQFFYLVMAAYGFYQWKYKVTENEEQKKISWWPLRVHFLVVISGAGMVWLSGYLLSIYTDAAIPYYDSFTTIFSIATTYMVTTKKIENWIYWFFIDGASVYMYINRELYLTAGLFVFYTIIVIFGFFRWLRVYKTYAYD